MKAFKVTYQHGHFIDRETDQRIVPVQGAEYIITASENAFKTEDDKLKEGKPFTAEQKAKWAEAEFGKSNYSKLLLANTQLFFRVGNSKLVQGDESLQYIFSCSLLEDLYLYKIPSRKGDVLEDWRLADCICVLDKCIAGGLTLSEKIPASSINKLFSHTVMFYFNMQRSSSCNAFRTFFIYKPGMLVTFDGAKFEHYEGLKQLRETHFQKLKTIKS